MFREVQKTKQTKKTSLFKVFIIQGKKDKMSFSHIIWDFVGSVNTSRSFF